jgi:hypothetical protein
MRNYYIFNDYPISLITNFTEEKKNIYNNFIDKNPDFKDRFRFEKSLYSDDIEINLVLSEESEISEHSWAVDFFESNVGLGRGTNGEGVKLEDNVYSDLYELFLGDEGVYFASDFVIGYDYLIVETSGDFDCRYKVTLQKDGLYWEEDED